MSVADPVGPAWGYVLLLGDNDAEVEMAAGAHTRIVKHCSPARKDLWVGILIRDHLAAVPQIARIKEEDFAVKAIPFTDEAVAMKAANEHMAEGIALPS